MEWFIALLVVAVVLAIAFVLGACRVASDADDASDAIYKSMTTPEPPAQHIAQPSRLHPSIQRAMGVRSAEDMQ